ncbi:MAG: 2-amino-4-hydroxy-6-hydroxymethyldihydropteridine diphosphokinase [Sphingomonadaceae bacterium]|nr:2-amino-4-hydroxy-6-hydroxymethyldihydropteridine diphosphokinase [Sphingomonadaceae bacterium]
MARTSYAIGLGSNRYRGGAPQRVLGRAIDTLAAGDLAVLAQSPIIATPPLGPGRRNYANAALVVETQLLPDALLALCKTIEAQFGRRAGQRWGDRTLDIDILLWSGGTWAKNGLIVPHPAFRERRFVLDALATINADWRDPVTGLFVRHLRHRLYRPIAVDPAFARP